MGDCIRHLGCRRLDVVPLLCGHSRALQLVPLLLHAVKETHFDHIVIICFKTLVLS